MKRFWAFYSCLPCLLLFLLFAVVLPAPSAAAPGVNSPVAVKFSTPIDAPDPNETFRLVNETRVNNSSPVLEADSRLGEIAKQRAEDMATRQYYSHKNPDGKYYYDFFEQNNLKPEYNCENLDLVFVPNQELVINEWMTSLNGHRACLLSANVTHAGYATTKLTLVNLDGSLTTAYLVVAIHAYLDPIYQ